MGRASLIFFALIVVFSGTGIPVHAQELWPGLEQYLSITHTTLPNGTTQFLLINNYDAALVAASWDYKCGGSSETGHSGFGDAAMNYANPVERGNGFGFAPPHNGCTGGINAVIWADGKELGDPDALQQIHDCRSAALKEIHQTVLEDFDKVGLENWSSKQTLEHLATRIAPYGEVAHLDNNHDIRVRACHQQALHFLTESIQDFQTTVANAPSSYKSLNGVFWRYLHEWEGALASTTYPKARTWWKQPLR